ncbi:STAS/SEC14 domain-containing protein [Pseudoalteromonas sp. K222D]|uniref:STAS/SEC14 domain-containing protein n=1 Tax=Pseudoalteromonas sp. K222D TaxID=2820756 RepID=UPI001AD61A5C|nr:STAS/SEC14 domain-containing protein [Pseudoalteromonas sp. K222D]MBO7926839.1 STAS/SEC14 domain-containing protein [Pseudoalteromonas sp. K222D]
MVGLTHGLSIGIERSGSEFFLTLKAVGTLTHKDYKIITPMIDSALSKVDHPIVKVLIDGSQLEGWEIRAAWDDLKLGLKHGKNFKKVAVYGNKEWQATLAKVAGWFVAGKVAYFENATTAIEWLKE